MDHCCPVTLTSYFRHLTSGNEVKCVTGCRVHTNSVTDKRVCLRINGIATVLIFSALNTHSSCDDNKKNTEHSLDFNEMD